MLRTYEIVNLEKKGRKEQQEEIFSVLGCVGSWCYGLVNVHVVHAREIAR